jgi:hypothetical protein
MSVVRTPEVAVTAKFIDRSYAFAAVQRLHNFLVCRCLFSCERFPSNW